MKPKSMRPIKELLAIYNGKEGTLSMAEARLIDLHTFHKTKKRIPEFAKKAKSKQPKVDILIGKSRKPKAAPKSGKASVISPAFVAPMVMSKKSPNAIANDSSANLEIK